MQIKKLLLLSLIIPCLTYAQYDNWRGYSNYLTRDSDTEVAYPYWRSDEGITLVGSKVSNWLSTNGNYEFEETTDSRRPTYDTDSLKLEFDGISNQLSVKDNYDYFYPGTNDFYCIVWLKGKRTGFTEAIIDNNRDNYLAFSGLSVFINSTNGYLYFRVSNGAAGVFVHISENIAAFLADGNWHMATFGRRNDSLFINIDKGTKFNRVAIADTFDIANSNYPFTICARYNNTFEAKYDISKVIFVNGKSISNAAIKKEYDIGHPAK